MPAHPPIQVNQPYNVLGLMPHPDKPLTLEGLDQARDKKLNQIKFNAARMSAVQKQREQDTLQAAYLAVLKNEAQNNPSPQCKPAFKRRLQELEEQEREEERKRLAAEEQARKAKQQKPQSKPAISVGDHQVVLQKGTLKDVELMFKKWLEENNLVGKGFEAVRVSENVLMLRGPATGPYADRMSKFMDQLVRSGHIQSNPLASPAQQGMPAFGNKAAPPQNTGGGQQPAVSSGIPRVPRPGDPLVPRGARGG